MTKFDDLGLTEALLRAAAKAGYEHPTPIQAEVIPAMLAGRDILGTAQTGTGKTAAFVLPLLDMIVRADGKPQTKGCRGLILVPTRELAVQIAEHVKAYSRFMYCSTALVVGGASAVKQIRALAKGVDLVIATPGRLLDHLSSGVIRLDKTSVVVLDEADQMLDMGFIPAIRRILSALPEKRQTALLSATMPKQIRKLAHESLSRPQEITMVPVSRPIERIEQKVLFRDIGGKPAALVEILKCDSTTRTIVFTRTKYGADKLARKLEKAGIEASALHGNKSQSQRQRALKSFSKGSIGVLVATDIAARGIDVDDISHVVNYDLPNVPETYIHRIGRTARAGKGGIAVSLCAPEESGLLRDIERHIGMSLDGDARPDTPAAPAPAAKRKRNAKGHANTRKSQPKSDRTPAKRKRIKAKPRVGRNKSAESADRTGHWEPAGGFV